MTSTSIDAAHFRQVLGQYPTGVVVITALDADGAPIGMTVGTFTSVSIDPPLVAFLPDQSSSSWRALRESGTNFCVNILSDQQEDVCRTVAVRKTNKFEGIAWSPSARGLPVIAGSVAYIDCSTEVVHEAGDHHIVIGRVEDLNVQSTAYPLLFFRGGYGAFNPHSLMSDDSSVREQLRLVDRGRPAMEELARRMDSEVTAIILDGEELVLAAAAGRTKIAVAPTRVGQRVPFVPPVGSAWAALGGDAARQQWLSAGAGDGSYDEVAARVAERGYAVAFGHAPSEQVERVSTRLHSKDPEVSRESLIEAMRGAADSYNPAELPREGTVELRSVSAPVYDADGSVAYTLTLWGPPGQIGSDEVQKHIDALLEAAASATQLLGGAVPAR